MPSDLYTKANTRFQGAHSALPGWSVSCFFHITLATPTCPPTCLPTQQQPHLPSNLKYSQRRQRRCGGGDGLAWRRRGTGDRQGGWWQRGAAAEATARLARMRRRRKRWRRKARQRRRRQGAVAAAPTRQGKSTRSESAQQSSRQRGALDATRAEPNGFRGHHFNHSATLLMYTLRNKL